MKDYYSILEIDKSANEAQIKQAFRRQAFKFHPDRNPSSDAAIRFTEIYEAYSTLINMGSRRKYDYYTAVNKKNNPSTVPPKFKEGGGKKYGTTYRYNEEGKTPPPHRKRKYEKQPDFRIMENMMFYSLIIIGITAIIFAIRDLVVQEFRGLDSLTGILFGLLFTFLLIFCWTKIYRKKD